MLCDDILTTTRETTQQFEGSGTLMPRVPNMHVVRTTHVSFSHYDPQRLLRTRHPNQSQLNVPLY